MGLFCQHFISLSVLMVIKDEELKFNILFYDVAQCFWTFFDRFLYNNHTKDHFGKFA